MAKRSETKSVASILKQINIHKRLNRTPILIRKYAYDKSAVSLLESGDDVL